MYGSSYDSIQTNDQYSNQQYSNKDYLIKNTQQCSNKINLQYPVKQELTTLNTPTNIGSLNENYIQNLTAASINHHHQQQIDSTDQWSINNYNNEFSSLLTPDSQHSGVSIQNTTVQSIQPNICNQSNLQANLQSPNVQSNNISANNIQQNIQSNVQFNIQLNVHPSISTNNTNLPIVQQTTDSIQNVLVDTQPSAVQFSNQLSSQLNTHNQLSNRTQQINQFDDYLNKDEPFTKKIKSEKNDFESINYSRIQSNYFNNNSIRQSNQIQTDFQCNLPYSNQQINRNTGNSSCFNNLLTNNNNEFINNLSTSTNCYLRQNMTNPNDQSAITYQSINKSDQQNYTTLISMNDEQKKLIIDNESSLKPASCLSNPTIQSTHSSQQSIERSLNNDNNYRTLDSSYLNSQSANFNRNQNLNQNLIDLNFNSSNQILNSKIQHNSTQSTFSQQINQSAKQMIKCKKSTEKCLINLIKNKKNADSTQLLSSNSIKLVHNKEVPNLRINSNKINQNRSNLNKSTSLLMDEEEKRKRRRERNKLAATKCRNKKKAHATQLNEQSVFLDSQNRELRSEVENLKMEEKRLAQILTNHKRICQLRFTMIANELEQIYEPNQFNQTNFSTTIEDFNVNNHLNNNNNSNNNNFSQPFPITDPQYKIGRIKMKKNYDLKTNQINTTNSINNQLYNNQQVFNQSIVKMEEYNYQTDFADQSNNYQSSNCFETINPPPYSQITSPQITNYNNNNRFNQNSTNYASTNQIIVNKTNESSNLTNVVDYLCTNNTLNNGNNDVFLC